MKKTRELGSLSIDETQKLLGAERPTSIGKLPANPLEMRMAPSIVRERLVSRGGRPSDPAWTVVRKVPMRPETWAELDRCAHEFKAQNVRVSAGQVAAIALERGLQFVSKRENVGDGRRNSNYSVAPDVRANAQRVLLALSHGSLFQCA
jgi:hypothetical protein